MKFKAITGKQGSGTDVKDATYVEAARWGKYRGWRYVLGLVVILFAWLVVGSIVAPLVAFLLGGQGGLIAFGRADYSLLGPFGNFLAIMAGFPFFLAGIFVAVVGIHRRSLRTLVTARERISWRRVGHGFVAGFVPACLIGGLAWIIHDR